MWDQKYNIDDYLYGTNPNDFLAQKLDYLPKGKVLCVADGEGRNSVFLAQQGYQVTAVDSSRVALQKAQKLAEMYQVEVDYIHADLADFDLGKEQWHGVVSIFCHLPPQLRQSLHQRILSGLKNDGVLLLEAYTPEQLKQGTGGPPDAALTLTRQILQQELGALDFEHLQELEREVIEGIGHTGQGSVIQLIARKSL